MEDLVEEKSGSSNGLAFADGRFTGRIDTKLVEIALLLMMLLNGNKKKTGKSFDIIFICKGTAT